MTPYFEEDKTAPALEFLSPLKGPNLEQILIEVGSGIKSAKEGALNCMTRMLRNCMTRMLRSKQNNLI